MPTSFGNVCTCKAVGYVRPSLPLTTPGDPAMPKTAVRPSKISETRRENLRKLIAERGGANALAKALGYTNASFLSQMCGPTPMREVTEKTARSFEAKLGLPSGTLDRENAATASPAAALSPAEVPLTVDVIRLVGKVLEDEGLNLPPMRFADVVALALTDTVEHGGKPRPEMIRSVVKLLK